MLSNEFFSSEESRCAPKALDGLPMLSDRQKAACRNAVRHPLSCRNVEFPRLEVRKGLIELRLRIHNERPACSDRFGNRVGMPKHNDGIVLCLQFDYVAVIAQLPEIELRYMLPLDGDTAAND